MYLTSLFIKQYFTASPRSPPQRNSDRFLSPNIGLHLRLLHPTFIELKTSEENPEGDSYVRREERRAEETTSRLELHGHAQSAAGSAGKKSEVFPRQPDIGHNSSRSGTSPRYEAQEKGWGWRAGVSGISRI